MAGRINANSISKQQFVLSIHVELQLYLLKFNLSYTLNILDGCGLCVCDYMPIFVESTHSSILKRTMEVLTDKLAKVSDAKKASN
jgi:hypothetical protein